MSLFPRFRFALFLFVIIAGSASNLQALDMTGGVMKALPTSKEPPALDGTDKGWDLSAAEEMWVSPQTAKLMNASLAANYDDDALYLHAKISLETGKLKNTNGPSDAFWAGDMLEFRLSSDPALPFPLSSADGPERVCHLSIWKNTTDGKIYLNIAYGGMIGNSKGSTLNPPGAQVSITENAGFYVVEAKVPWSVLKVPGGKNPYAAGSRMTAIWGVHWGFANQIAALYTVNPGAFGFMKWDTWGQVEFSPTGHVKPSHPTMEQFLAASALNAKPVGIPITIDVPEGGKLSVNIVGEHGEVIRDITGGEPVAAGKTTVYWDGYDQWGFPQKPGDYHWAAYFSHGLKANYVASVGSSGDADGWGGDHGVPSSTAADASGIYLGWSGSEAEAQIVKIDYAGKTLFRKTPFLSGGFATLNALTSNTKYLFAYYDIVHPVLARLDPTNGTYVLYKTDTGTSGTLPLAPGEELKGAPGVCGIAATATEVFCPLYTKNIIQVVDVESGKLSRTIPCQGVACVSLDQKGNLYAVTYPAGQSPQVVRFNGTSGDAKPVITEGLETPGGVAIDPSGIISVTDAGSSNQIKIFSPDGKLMRTLGKKGGRPWIGTYDPEGFLLPSAITLDQQGGLVIAESSIPKIFDRIDAATGKNEGRWFGWPSYGVSNIGDPDNPLTSYFPFEPTGFGRATATEGKNGLTDAYWDMPRAGYDKLYGMLPYVSILSNGRKYLIDDCDPHCVAMIKGDQMLPVGHLDVHNHGNDHDLEIWIDKNGDHKPQPDEVTTVTSMNGIPVAGMGDSWCSMWMDKDGNAYFTKWDSVLKIPSDGFDPNGAILWNVNKASLIVPTLVPGALGGGLGGRFGVPGVCVDSKGNTFVCMSTYAEGLTPELEAKIKSAFPDLPQSQWCVYADKALAKKMEEGLGHSGESNVAKFAKYGPDGKMLWIAGRKATAAPNQGEMYHFIALAGLVDDNYVAGASEWGPIYIYTSDGFYVDALMNDPATLPAPGPYTFGSETFGGRIEANDKLGKVYAYNQGGIYTVDGFTKELKVDGERRFSGTLNLDKVYSNANQGSVVAGLQISPISGDIAQDGTWTSVPSVTINRAGIPLSTNQIGYDKDNVYARIHVVDDTPLQNVADDLNVVFKGGDVVGLDLGPSGDRQTPGPGDVRILAASIHGQAKLIGMKPHSSQTKQPQHYTTPAAGTKSFDFVGEIPGGKVTLTPDADGKGYTAWLTIPQSFFEFPITAGTKLKGDVEVLISGTGQRGLQAVARNWLNSGGHVETTMVDDIPTESWLYPQYWGDVTVK